MNKRIIVLSLIMLLMICIACEESPGEKDILIKKINLEDKDFNIELYLDRSGGVYASEYYQIFKAYKDGTYDLIYSKKYRDREVQVEIYNNNEIVVYEKFENIESRYVIDTLANGLISHTVKTTLLSTEYDTTYIDLDSFWDW